MRVTTVSVETMKVVGTMQAANRSSGGVS